MSFFVYLLGRRAFYVRLPFIVCKAYTVCVLVYYLCSTQTVAPFNCFYIYIRLKPFSLI